MRATTKQFLFKMCFVRRDFLSKVSNMSSLLVSYEPSKKQLHPHFHASFHPPLSSSVRRSASSLLSFQIKYSST